MNRFGNLLLASFGLAACISALNQTGAIAQSGTVSSETTVETRGVGFKGANVFNPKYKERIGTYAEQIEMGSTKGWLTAAEVEQFKTRLEGMKQQEAAAAAKGWVKADVDAIDKVFTQFNIDLTKAANKPAKAAPATPAATTAKPAGTVAGGETKTTTTKKTTTTAKPKTPVVKTTAKATVKKTTK
jgi:hypothetical protein